MTTARLPCEGLPGKTSPIRVERKLVKLVRHLFALMINIPGVRGFDAPGHLKDDTIPYRAAGTHSMLVECSRKRPPPPSPKLWLGALSSPCLCEKGTKYEVRYSSLAVSALQPQRLYTAQASATAKC